MYKRYLIVWFCLCAAAFGADITFDVCDVSHSFDGFGAQIWPGDSRVESLTTALNLKYYRIAPGGCSSPPVDATTTVMDAYVSSQYNGTSRGNAVEYSLAMAQTLGVKVILIKFGCVPSTWLGTGSRLKSAYFNDFARIWASEVLYFKNCGYTIDYIELFNEPEGNWNVYCPGADYNTVVKLVRAELDSRGLSNVGIIGPGLAVLTNGTSWINALDTNGKNAIGAWSTHAWDESWWGTSALPSYLDQRWKNYFGAAVNLAAPTHSKPIIVTEYATGVQTYNGVTFDSNHFCDSNQFAQRCYENSLTMANNGANVLCYWEAANQSWQDNFFGWQRVNSTYRPVYYSFLTLAPYIPDNAKVLTKTWTGSQISASGFFGSNRLVMAFANSTANTVTRSVQVTGVSSLVITTAKAFEAGVVTDELSNVSFDYASGTMNVTLPRESTLTVVAMVNECGSKLDVNHDCKTTFADFIEISADWMKDNLVPEEKVVEDFESYASSAAVSAAWVVHVNGDPATETLVDEGGNKCLKLLYNTNGSNAWLQTKYLLPGAVWLGSGVNWASPGYTNISFKYKITDQGSDLTQFTIWNSGGTKIAGADIGSGTVTGGWVTVNLNLQTIKASGQNYQNVGLIGFTAKNTYYDSPTGDIYFDNVILSNSENTVCFGTIVGDINDDCVVDFEDVWLFSQKWLECRLMEQSQCW
ncbi:MAG: hypothetical protein LLF92_07625 [Planctomycetaceae bacterium]|nr:hypothetical protein [Planctomycetaceae bacterium]